MRLDNIPQELKNNGLFCVWKLVDGKGKVPYNPSTRTLAKSNNKNTFMRYEDILKYLGEYMVRDENNRAIAGLGLGIFNGYSAIDIDKCRDAESGKLTEMAMDIIEYCKSYTEISPSGTGIRIIFKTENVIDKKTHYVMNQQIGLEIYISENTNKYVTLTGDILYPAEIETIDITYILERYMKKNSDATALPTIKKSVEDYDLKLKNALRYNAKFKEVWHSQASGSGGNESETDLSLCNMLAVIFEGNYTAIDDAFRESPYYATKDVVHREKWEKRNDYREETIKKAITSYHQYRIERATEFELNDTGNARRFADSYKDVVRYNVDNMHWMVWNGKYWQTDMFATVKIMAEAVIEQMRIDMNNATSEDTRKAMLNNIKRTMNSSNKQAMIKEAQHIDGIPVTNAMFDTQPHLFNCKSGVVDIRTGEIIPHDKTLLLSRYTDVEVSYEKPTLWLKFLSEIFENNKQMISYVQRAFGYALTGYMKEQSMFILHGDGSNGKSLLLEVIAKIIGGYGTTSSVNILVERKVQATNMSEIARLNKIRYVVTDETEIGDKLRESAIKGMTSDYGDIVARFLYGNEFTFKPQFKIFMATNHKPIIRGTDHGIWRRIKLIPFNVVIPDDKQDRSLGDKLRHEYSQILGWLLQGAKLWYESGLSVPETMSEAITEYRSEMDLVQKWINDNCDVDSGLVSSSAELFKNITQYCVDNKEFQMSNTLFGRNMGKKFEKRRIGGVMCYIGISLRKDKLDVAIDKANYAEGLSYRDV